MNYFSKNIKYLTKERGEQSKLANLLNRNRQDITKWINGSEPGIETLIKLSEIYTISIDILVKVDLEKSNYNVKKN